MNYFSNRYALKGNKLQRADNLIASFKQEKIDAERLKNYLLSISGAPKDVTPESYDYYVYYIEEKPRFVFVTGELINLAQLESKWGKREEAFMVEGALYDLKHERFVKCPDVTPHYGSFYTFLIYDAGVPNIIIGALKTYIFFEKDNMLETYKFEQATNVEEVVVHLQEEGGIISRQRVLFYTVLTNSGLEDRMLVLHGDIKQAVLDKNVVYIESLYDCFTVAGQGTMIHFHGLGTYNDFDKANKMTKVTLNTELIGGSSCVIVRNPYGALGEYVFVLLHRKVEYKVENSCLKYEVTPIMKGNFVTHLVVLVTTEKSDFESREDYFDVTDNLLYPKDELDKLLSEE